MKPMAENQSSSLDLILAQNKSSGVPGETLKYGKIRTDTYDYWVLHAVSLGSMGWQNVWPNSDGYSHWNSSNQKNEKWYVRARLGK